MPTTKPPLVPLHQLTPGQAADCFVLLAEKTRHVSRDGKTFYICRFRDARRSVSTLVWSDSLLFNPCEREWQVGQFYKVRGTFKEHEQYGPQFDLTKIRPVQDSDRADGFDPALLVERSRFDAEVMFNELCELVSKEIADAPVRKLVMTLLAKYVEPLKRLPATQGKFFPFAGGLLEHTLSVTRNCLLLADRYIVYYPDLKPPLNRDLVVAGAVLHDLGRVAELEGELGQQATVPGRLFGHLLLGRDLVHETARELGDVNPELVQMLEHIVISHLTIPEWGSPRLPLVPECLIVHHADDLDAKLEMFARCLSRDQSAGPFTDRDPGLGRQLLKARSV